MGKELTSEQVLGSQGKYTSMAVNWSMAQVQEYRNVLPLIIAVLL